MRSRISTCSSNANPHGKSGMIWPSFLVFLILLLFMFMQPSNGGADKRSHHIFSSLLWFGVHGTRGILKFSETQRPPIIPFCSASFQFLIQFQKSSAKVWAPNMTIASCRWLFWWIWCLACVFLSAFLPRSRTHYRCLGLLVDPVFLSLFLSCWAIFLFVLDAIRDIYLFVYHQRCFGTWLRKLSFLYPILIFILTQYNLWKLFLLKKVLVYDSNILISWEKM